MSCKSTAKVGTVVVVSEPDSLKGRVGYLVKIGEGYDASQVQTFRNDGSDREIVDQVYDVSQYTTYINPTSYQFLIGQEIKMVDKNRLGIIGGLKGRVLRHRSEPIKGYDIILEKVHEKIAVTYCDIEAAPEEVKGEIDEGDVKRASIVLKTVLLATVYKDRAQKYLEDKDLEGIGRLVNGTSMMVKAIMKSE